MSTESDPGAPIDMHYAELLGATSRERNAQLSEIGMVIAGLLEEQMSIQKKLEQTKEELARAVDDARNHGVSWARIGNLLGISREASYQRYGRKKLG